MASSVRLRPPSSTCRHWTCRWRSSIHGTSGRCPARHIRRSASRCSPVGRWHAGSMRSSRTRSTWPPRARWVWPPGTGAFVADAHSRPLITPSFRSTYVRAPRYRWPGGTRRCDGFRAVRGEPSSLRRRCRRNSSAVDSPTSRAGAEASTAAFSARATRRSWTCRARSGSTWGGSRSRRASATSCGLDLRAQGRHRRRTGARATRSELSAGTFRRLPARRGTRPARGGLRRLRVPEPHRHVRPGPARGDGVRPAGRRLSGDRPLDVVVNGVTGDPRRRTCARRPAVPRTAIHVQCRAHALALFLGRACTQPIPRRGRALSPGPVAVGATVDRREARARRTRRGRLREWRTRS